MSQQSQSSPPPENHPADAARVTADEQLLRIPPLTERRGFVDSEPWRVLRILGEFVTGFEELADVRRAVSFSDPHVPIQPTRCISSPLKQRNC